MKIFDEIIKINTTKRCEMIDITDQVQQVLNKSNTKQGTVTIYCPHTTAAVTINENADPSVTHDILLTLEQLIPHHRTGYRHSEGNSDAHVKSSLVGCSKTVLIKDGRLILGTWQGIYLCEFDGPRSRSVIVRITEQ